MVTICTVSLTFSNSTFCPHTVFMCFAWISEQTAIISLYSINWLVFITETRRVYCAVRTGSLYMWKLILVCQTLNATHFHMLLQKQIVSFSKRFPLNSRSRPLTLSSPSLPLRTRARSLSLCPSLSLPPPLVTTQRFATQVGGVKRNITAKPIFVTIISRTFG